MPYREIVKLTQRSQIVPFVVRLDANAIEVNGKRHDGGSYSSVRFGQYNEKEVAIKYPIISHSNKVSCH